MKAMTMDLMRALSSHPQLGGLGCFYFAGAGEGGGGGGEGKDTEPTLDDLKAQLKAKTDELANEVNSSKKYRQRAQTAEEELKRLNDRVAELETAADATKSEQERKALEAQGKYEEALKAAAEEHRKEKAALQEKLTALTGQLHTIQVTQRLTELLGKAGVATDRLADAQRLASLQVTSTLKDGQLVVQVQDEAGKPFEVEGEGDVLETYVKKFVETHQYFLPPSGDTGSGAQKGTPAGITIEELDADPDKKAQFIKERGQQAYLELATQGPQKGQ